MSRARRFFIGGEWVEPSSPRTAAVVNPATEETVETLALGAAADVDRAVGAARAAFPAYAATSVEERVALLRRIAQGLRDRRDELARLVSLEMGAPLGFAREVHVGMSIGYVEDSADVLARFHADCDLGDGVLVTHEPVGVCGLITPWNWPINQIFSKLANALAAGCTVVLKPSRLAPLSALRLADLLDQAGVPPGVFNLVNGDGTEAGQALAAHPDVDMVSFTGSTRAGVEVAKAAADSVKRVHQELGGKSAFIVLEDADLEAAVGDAVKRCFVNAGQSCIAPTRLFVPRARRAACLEAAEAAAATITPIDPQSSGRGIGPVCGAAQFATVQRMIGVGVAEGARLVHGGPGRAEGFARGFFVRPTVFADVTPAMTIAREEIFGPVLAILTYRDEDEAIALANASEYGLGAYVHSRDLDRARRVGRRLRAGRVYLNDAPASARAPFGGYRRSGNGRELGEVGLKEFMEVKAMLGYSS